MDKSRFNPFYTGQISPKVQFYDCPFLIQSTIGSIQMLDGEKKSRCPDPLSNLISVFERLLEDWSNAPLQLAAMVSDVA